MTQPDGRWCAELFESNPHDAVESLVVSEFRAALLMGEDDVDEPPLEASFFDLGLTSLRLMEIKKRIEEALGVEISTTALFNFPTITRLVDYLMDNVLPRLTPAPETLVSSVSSTSVSSTSVSSTRS